MKTKIVVCGATGNQGSAVAKRLLANSEWEVVAISRNPQSQSATELAYAGAVVVKADTNDLDSLQQAFEGAYGVFGVTQPWSADYKQCNIEQEIGQAQNVIKACQAARVQHLVMSSIINPSNQKTGAPHVDSKLLIEEQVKQAHLPYTIIRFPQFMDNIGAPFFPVKRGTVKGFIAADAKVPYIACKDIGKAVAEAFQNPVDSAYQTLNVIGDFVSGHELACTLSNLRNGEKFTYKAAPKLLLRLFAKEFYHMRLMFEQMGHAPYPAEIAEALLHGTCNTTLQAHLHEQGFANRVL
ncbi:NmrA/HSCARG family protein [Mucilaginibacter koreensis]